VIVQPRTIKDVVRVVSDTSTYPSPVRAVGKLHSPAPCSADDGGTMLDMTSMTRILEIGPDFVTAEAGALYIDVAEELARHDRQFHINTEIGTITLGAIACAATKDSSLIGSSHYGQVSSFVSGVKVVKPDGTVCSFTEDEHPEQMRLLRLSYGLLGVVVEVTLKTQPISALFAEHRAYTLAEFRAAVPELIAQNYALMMYFYPFADRVVLEVRREEPDTKPTSSGGWWLRNAFWRKYGPLFVRSIRRISPTDAIEHALIRFYDRLMRRGICWLVGGKLTVPHAQIIRHVDDPGDNKIVFSIWSFDEDSYFDTLEAYFRFCKEYAEQTGFRCNLPAVGYRIVQDRNALLSYTHDSDALSIDPVSTGGPEWEEFLKAFNAFCSDRDGHPLFNQTKHLTAVQVRKAYGKRWEEFAQVRAKWDPEDRLLSQYFADLLDDMPIT
jgi:FAD/FMN-containing dehydrogenase